MSETKNPGDYQPTGEEIPSDVRVNVEIAKPEEVKQEIDRLNEIKESLGEQLEAFLEGKVESTSAVRLAFDEAANNKIYHGLLGLPGQKGEELYKFANSKVLERISREGEIKGFVVFTFVEVEGALKITISDAGAEFDFQNLTDATHPDNLLSPHGRGIFFIKSMLGEKNVKFQDGGKTIEMTVPYK